ncbi:uncharacterized protein LOC131667579 [Phymastichus coffea]|uniref:uncharacterized protein LOC131667579 n=1 Tax=Phymastichus coffea TaxID=108790 RepID=UPI00273C5A8B|nr:uncharacterized protein LOC131667579 [Phymastichus coffea]
MSSNSISRPEAYKQTEARPQSSSVQPMGPPPTYTEAMNSSPYPPMPLPYATTPYPIGETTMPLPQPTEPYPVDDNVPARPMSTVHSSMPEPVHASHTSVPTVDLSNSILPRSAYQQPIVNQPAAYSADHEHIYPKTTYVVLQDDRNRRREDSECSCIDWLMCCWCCIETCRCISLCVDCCK